MVSFIGWFTGTGSNSSTSVDSSGGGGGWGAFTPNVGSFASSGSGFDSFGGFGIGSDRGGGFGDSSFALDRGGGGGGGWGAFQPSDDGFTNSEPLGGYAGTMGGRWVDSCRQARAVPHDPQHVTGGEESPGHWNPVQQSGIP